MTRVLVVDDDPRLLRTLSIALRAHGDEVLTANDGRSAVQSAAEDATGALWIGYNGNSRVDRHFHTLQSFFQPGDGGLRQVLAAPRRDHFRNGHRDHRNRNGHTDDTGNDDSGDVLVHGRSRLLSELSSGGTYGFNAPMVSRWGLYWHPQLVLVLVTHNQ